MVSSGANGMKFIKRIVGALAVVLALVYAGDDLSVRIPIPNSKKPFGTVQIKSYYAIPQKDRKTEFYLADPVTQTCVHSMFPHLGYSPCWYLERRKVQRIDE
jgi:hypothetical protein